MKKVLLLTCGLAIGVNCFGIEVENLTDATLYTACYYNFTSYSTLEAGKTATLECDRDEISIHMNPTNMFTLFFVEFGPGKKIKIHSSKLNMLHTTTPVKPNK